MCEILQFWIINYNISYSYNTHYAYFHYSSKSTVVSTYNTECHEVIFIISIVSKNEILNVQSGAELE